MRILRKAVAADRVGYHPEHLMRLVRQGKFPKPVNLGPRSIGFVEEEVDAFIKARIAERDAGKTMRPPKELQDYQSARIAKCEGEGGS